MSTQTSPVTGIQTWKIDPSHSEIGFSVRHMMISKVRGTFNSFQGSIVLDPEDVSTGKAEIEIDTASINTKEENRDQHLRSADFFAAENYPKITFVTREIKATGDGGFTGTGELTIMDTTREIDFTGEITAVLPDAFGGIRAGFAAQTTINRKEFGLTWHQAIETGGVVVSDEVKINLDFQAVLEQ